MYTNLSEVLSGYQEYAAASAARFAEPVAYQPAPKPSPKLLDLSNIPEGFYAVPNGETRLKVQIKKPSTGKWKGFTFVSDGAAYGTARRYGMQRPYGTYSGAIMAELRTIAANPLAASQAYGRLTCRCGVCNRPLEDAESVSRGIGPVCFGKFA